ncbi:universal stress protein [Streptantibioticus rubrisoli]|uniref:Universal stress protein n=1 Tax=Streptantibioticus rubrisoli TaxID=1387313 RepID=A0ABT1PBH3_9ACTN|nr:universal stress protein [Streptantibioticus rubrisoli]MCQ4042724.1 universal stress protein [Streptantibioticus rubrisoli]
MDTRSVEKWADGPVVVGTDGSDDAAAAVAWAAQEAAVRNQPLHIVHATGVDDWGSGLNAADTARLVLQAPREILDAAVKLACDRAPDLRVSTEVSGKRPWAGLLHAADDATTIVVGSRGLGGFAALLLGSVGLKVAGHASGPVAVIRGTADRTAGRVVVGVRDEADLDVVRFAAQTAGRWKASLHLVSGWTLVHNLESAVPVPDAVWAAGAAAASSSERVVDSVRAEFPNLAVSAEAVQLPSPARALVDASAGAALLVVGARNPAHPHGAPLGRVTHAVLHHAYCPVAVLPHG